MTAVSAFMPESANSVVLGSRSASAPNTTRSGEVDLRPASSRSRSSAMRAPSAARSASAAAAAAPKAGDARHVLGSGAGAALLPATLDERIGERHRRVASDQRADALEGPDLVPRNREKIGARAH